MIVDLKNGVESIDARLLNSVTLSLVVPVYNEADSVSAFLHEVDEKLGALPGVRLELVFVNDGSTDSTLAQLRDVQLRFEYVRVVDLSRNFGKEAALTAGLRHCTGHVVVPMDADLQDPPGLVVSMLDLWRQGFDVVLAQRVDRSFDSWVKRSSARWFYRVHNFLADPKIPEDVGDFRLMDRCVVDALNMLPESCRFMKGLLAWVGFSTATVTYARPSRVAGSTKFSGWRLWNFALEGLTGFSTAALRVWTYLGGLVAVISLCFAMYIVVRVAVWGVDVPGYASVMVAVSFLGGLQLLGIGVVGEYLSRVHIESKRRPVYLIRRIYEGGGK